MTIQYSFKHMEVSQALKDFTDERLQEILQRFLSKPGNAHVVFSVEKHISNVSCHVSGGEGVQAQVDHSGTDMYATVEEMLDKLSVQLKKHKEKLKDHKGHAPMSELAPDVLSKEDKEFEDASIDASDIKKLVSKNKN